MTLHAWSVSLLTPKSSAFPSLELWNRLAAGRRSFYSFFCSPSVKSSSKLDAPK